MKLIIFLVGYVVAFEISTFAQNNCTDSLSYSAVRERWNNLFSKIKDNEATWILPNYRTFNSESDTMQILYSLYGSEISFTATVTKNGCLRRISIFSKRKKSIGTQALVAMLYLIKSLNPELTPGQAKEAFDKLLNNKNLENHLVIGNNSYHFIEDVIKGNILSVTTKN